MSDGGPPIHNRGRKKALRRNLKERPQEIFLDCPSCCKKYLLQEEETLEVSFTCLRCGLIILL